jgi:hypothetical protein
MEWVHVNEFPAGCWLWRTKKEMDLVEIENVQ